MIWGINTDFDIVRRGRRMGREEMGRGVKPVGRAVRLRSPSNGEEKGWDGMG